jgi:hypothetical protein
MEHYSSKLIFVAAGGNIITLFAKILDIISTLNFDGSNVDKFLQDYFNDIYELDKIKHIFKDFIKKIMSSFISYPSLLKDIRYVSSCAFSDLDFNLLPNKIKVETHMEGSGKRSSGKRSSGKRSSGKRNESKKKSKMTEFYKLFKIDKKGPYTRIPMINVDRKRYNKKFETNINYVQEQYFPLYDFDENTMLLESIYDENNNIADLLDKQMEYTLKIDDLLENKLKITDIDKLRKINNDIYDHKLQIFLIDKRVELLKKNKSQEEYNAPVILKKQDDGFFLLRVKTKYSLKKEIIDSDKSKELLSDKYDSIKKLYEYKYKIMKYDDCSNYLQVLSKANVNLIPNLITQESIENAKSKINDDCYKNAKSKINDDCYKFLEKLLAKKHVMDFSTSKNTENITKFDIENNEIDYDQMVLEGDTIDKHQKTKNMIKNIRHITIMLNKKLANLEPTMSANLNDFDDLKAMSESNLPLIGASLLQKFLESNFFDSLNHKLNLYYTNNKFIAETSTFNIIHPFTLYSNLHKFYEPLEKNNMIVNSIDYKKKYPRGIRVTINIVQPLDTNIDKETAKGKKKKKTKKKKTKKKLRKKLRKKFKKTIKKIKLLTKKCKNKENKNTKTCKKFNKIKKKYIKIIKQIM